MEILFLFALLVLVHLQNRSYDQKAPERAAVATEGAAYDARKAEGIKRLQARLRS